jgi:acyl carrier protein
MAHSQTARTILEFLVNDLLYDKDVRNLTPSDPLLESGLLDSLAILRTVAFCEETYGIRIDDADVIPENFENVGALAALIERNLANGK